MNNFIIVLMSSLKRNFVRALLTSLGIMIGIASVAVVISASSGFEKYILDQLSMFGDDWVDIEVKHPLDIGLVGFDITTLVNGDKDAIKSLPNIKTAYNGSMTQEVVSYQGDLKRVNIYAISNEFFTVDKSTLADGRFFTAEEEAAFSKVVILGKNIKERFFQNEDPLNKFIRINNRNFRIIGYYEELGTIGGMFSYDDMIFIPLKTQQKVLYNIDYALFIIAQVKDKNLMASTAEDIKALMRERHDVHTEKEEDFRVTTMDEAMSIIGTIVKGVQLLLLAIAGISLVVGGVGIMNVMYVNVVERTFEIGLRKAIGAKKRNIMLQFLSEAVIMTLVGGFIGVSFAFLLSLILGQVIKFYNINLDVGLTFQAVLISTIFSLLVGIIFGVYPARKAANLDPIVALRKKI